MTALYALYGLCLFALVVSVITEKTVLANSLKAATSVMFVVIAFSLELPFGSPSQIAILIGLLFGFCGDIALISKEKRWFIFGLISFLFNHVAFTVGLVFLHPTLLVTATSLIIVTGLGLFLERWLRPHTGRLHVPVVLYLVTIAIMVAVSCGVSALFGAAAIVFAVSDLFVARQRFIKKSPINRALGLPLYFAAQLSFALLAAAL